MIDLRGLRRLRWASWFGVLALALNAALPVHLAFDLAAAFGASGLAPPHEEHSTAEHEGHHHHHHDGDKPGQPGHDHGATCQFCAAAVTLAGFAPATAVALPVPPVSAVALVALPANRFALKAALSAYRSRAPPIA